MLVYKVNNKQVRTGYICSQHDGHGLLWCLASRASLNPGVALANRAATRIVITKMESEEGILRWMFWSE